MRLFVVIGGIAILTTGLSGAAFGMAASWSAQTQHDILCPNGQLPPSICDRLLATAASYRTIAFIAALIGVGGFVVVLAGAIMKGPSKPPSPMYAPMPPPLGASGVPPTGKPCPSCERANLSTDRFCANCGSPI